MTKQSLNTCLKNATINLRIQFVTQVNNCPRTDLFIILQDNM